MMTAEEYNDKPTGSDDGRDDLMLRLEFCLNHRATGELIPQHLMTEAFGILEDQQARIAALEAQVAVADRLAAATNDFDLLSRNETQCTIDEADAEIERLFAALRAELAAYRAAKGE